MAFWTTNDGAVLVRTTVGSRREAEQLARRLVDARLAACVHIGEVASVYRWEGKVRQETELLVEARTSPGRRKAVEAAMKQGHAYKVPLIETLTGTQVDAAYRAWMDSEVR